jgi:uncharacterized membrane protein YgcG
MYWLDGLAGCTGWLYWLDVLAGCTGWMYWLDVLAGSTGWKNWLDELPCSHPERMVHCLQVQEGPRTAQQAVQFARLLMNISGHFDPQWQVLCNAAARFVPSVLDSCFVLLGRLDNKPTLSASKGAGRGGSSRSSKHKSGAHSSSKAGGGSTGGSGKSSISAKERKELVSAAEQISNLGSHSSTVYVPIVEKSSQVC